MNDATKDCGAGHYWRLQSANDTVIVIRCAACGATEYVATIPLKGGKL